MAIDVTRLEENKQLIRGLYEAVWNQGDLDGADEILPRDYLEHNPALPKPIRGRDAYKENVASFREAFVAFEIVPEDVIAEGDIVVYRHTGRGTHEGSFMGLKPTGNSFEIAGVAVHRIENGHIAEAWVAIDALGLFEQLDAVSRPGSAGVTSA